MLITHVLSFRTIDKLVLVYKNIFRKDNISGKIMNFLRTICCFTFISSIITTPIQVNAQNTSLINKEVKEIVNTRNWAKISTIINDVIKHTVKTAKVKTSPSYKESLLKLAKIYKIDTNKFYGEKLALHTLTISRLAWRKYNLSTIISLLSLSEIYMEQKRYNDAFKKYYMVIKILEKAKLDFKNIEAVLLHSKEALLKSTSIQDVIKVQKYISNYNPRYYKPHVVKHIKETKLEEIKEQHVKGIIYVPISMVPKNFLNALISAEDQNSFQYAIREQENKNDLNPKSFDIIKAYRDNKGLYSNFTQKVVSMIVKCRPWSRLKCKSIAYQLESAKGFSHNKVLQYYVNNLYFGMGSIGIFAASRNYFEKSLNQLTISEVAYLAAVIKHPPRYHPTRRAKNAIARRNWVIEMMLAKGYISERQAITSKAKLLDVSKRISK